MAASAQMTSDIVPLYSFILLSTFSDRKSEAEGEEEEERRGAAWRELSGGGQGSLLEILP